MQIVNQTVPRGAAGRSVTRTSRVEAIVEFIAEHGHVIDAPGLRQEHYEVFDCAMGGASDQGDGPRADDGGGPAVSCPVRSPRPSTCPPETATVEDIEDVYFQGWKLGLKALAVYRDKLQGRPAAVRGQGRQQRHRGSGRGRRQGRRIPPDPHPGCRKSRDRRRPRRSPWVAPRVT